MNLFKTSLLLVIACFLASTSLFAQDKTENKQSEQMPAGYQVNYKIDNIGYWRKMAALGLVPVSPDVNPPQAVFTSSKIIAKGVRTADSPDVPVTGLTSTQSENSIFVNPNDRKNVLNSNNSTQYPNASSIYGANDFYSFNEGSAWEGEVEGPNGNNSGDPTTAINVNGRYFIGYINSAGGQSVSYSDDQGATWTKKDIANSGGGFNDLLDKNHMWIDNSPTSPYNGYLYDAWTNFEAGGSSNNDIEIMRSIDAGLNWTNKTDVSTAVNAGSHCQGVNLHTGPNGEVYAAFSVYDGGSLLHENAIGLARSLDGGATWLPSTRIINNINGIRNVPSSVFKKNMRVNSFPSMTVDISAGPNSGNIYIIWPNIGYPGINTGTGIDVYMIKSSDQGLTWSTPVKVNQDPFGLGKQHYLCWITCDPSSGDIAAIFYDDRNVSPTQCETYVAVSRDGGSTFEDFKVSDVAFTPTPIPGLATGYFGDYLSITANGGMVYPCWTDNRSGHAMTYVSPIELIIYKPNVAYDSHIIDDAATGNGNGNLDFGENVDLTLALTNSGNLATTGVQATISTDSPYITLTDSTENYGDFGIGETKSITDAFAFTANQNTPGGTQIIFTIKAVDANDSVFLSNFVVTTHGPALQIGTLTVSDPLGNNNGRLDPGETAEIHIQTTNTGDFVAGQVLSQVTSSNPFVTINNASFNLGSLTPGQSAEAIFNVTVNSSAAIGTAVKFHNLANSGYLDVSKDFVAKIGLIVEDWETGTFTKFPWVAGGDSAWVIDNVVKQEGSFSSRSGGIGDSQSSTLSVPYNVMYDDSISFFRKVSSELQDKLKFYIDDYMVAQWAGNRDWARYAYPVTLGPHTFKWEYVKNATASVGQDCSWVDFIVFPPEFRTSISAGNDASICQGSAFQPSGLAMNYQSLAWTTSGTGTFDDATILSPVYTPGASDIAAGTVVLTLTATGISPGEVVTDDINLTINAPATASAGPDAAICSGNTFAVTGASATNYAGYSWATSGDGSFNDAALLMPVYTPGPADLLAGSAKLLFTVVTGNTCPAVTDSAALTVHPLPVVKLANDTSICANHTLVINGTTANAAAYLWSPGGQTSASISIDSTGVGLGSRTYTLSVTDQFGCTGNGSRKITFQDCSGIEDKVGQVSFSLFPNPSDGHFSIVLNSRSKETVNIQIVNEANQAIYSVNRLNVNGTFTKQIDLSSQASGAYMLLITNRDASLSRKLIIR